MTGPVTAALEAYYHATFGAVMASIEAPGHDPEGRWLHEDAHVLLIAATFRDAIEIARRVEGERSMPSHYVCPSCQRGEHGRCTAEDGCACLACWGDTDDEQGESEESDEA